MIKTFLFTIFILFYSQVFAAEERTLGKSARALLMGDAYTAIADDEYTLFYNPAILARHDGFSFNPINPSISAINILNHQDALDTFSSGSSNPSTIVDGTLGLPIHLGASATPSFKFANFGLTGIFNNQTNIKISNKVSPVLDIDHRYDRGFIAGYGQAIFGSYNSEMGGEHLALGISVKYLKRESINNAFNLTGGTTLDLVNAGEIDALLAALGKINGQGWGFDIGLDYAKSSGPTTFTAGLAFLDVITKLETEDNEDNFEVQPQPMQVNFGTAMKASAGAGVDLTVSLDVKHLEQRMELMRRLYLGAELGLTPAFSLLAGINGQDNYSYGLKLNTGLLKFYVGLYSTEIGEKLNQEESHRAVIYFSLFDFSFNP